MLNPAIKMHLKQLSSSPDEHPTLLTCYMFSPAPMPSTINDVIQPAKHAMFKDALTSFLSPECGWVSPDFLEYQDVRDEQRVEEDGEAVEVQADNAGATPPSIPVCIPLVNDISDVVCTHNRVAKYCHNEDHDQTPIFTQHTLGVLHAGMAAKDTGCRPLM